MTTPTNHSRTVLIFGSIASIVTIVIPLIFLNPPQCPTKFTQAQVDASGCNVGANIGLGLAILLAGAIFLSTLVVAAILKSKDREYKKHK
jgi:hypothetical protein